MKKILLIGAYFLLSACSRVDSVHVLDDRQAAALAEQIYTVRPAREMIKISLPREQNWQKSRNTDEQSNAMMLTLKDQTANSNERIQTKITPFANHPYINARRLFESELLVAKSDCRETKAKILAENPAHLTYQLVLAGCRNEKNQLQIGKVFNGIDAVYSVQYAASGASPAQINALSQVIKSAQLVQDPRFSRS